MSPIMIPFRSQSRGFALLETLFAILIFSIAIIGVTYFQGSALRESGQARYRSEATIIANQVIGDLWAGSPSGPGSLIGTNTYSLSSNATSPWAIRVGNLLPNGSITLNIPNPVATGTASSSYQVTVTVNWNDPGEATVHTLEYQALINGI